MRRCGVVRRLVRVGLISVRAVVCSMDVAVECLYEELMYSVCVHCAYLTCLCAMEFCLQSVWQRSCKNNSDTFEIVLLFPPPHSEKKKNLHLGYVSYHERSWLWADSTQSHAEAMTCGCGASTEPQPESSEEMCVCFGWWLSRIFVHLVTTVNVAYSAVDLVELPCTQHTPIWNT